MAGSAWVRFPPMCNFAKIWKFAYQAPVFESCKAPAGDFRLGRKTQQVGGKLEQVSCKLE